MMMLFIASLIVLFVSAIVLFCTTHAKIINTGIFLMSLFLGCIFCAIPALYCLIHRTSIDLHIPSHMPIGEFFVGIDPLSALYLLVSAVLFFWAGVYGVGYLQGSSSRKTGVHYALYHLLLIALLMVVTARNAILFLAAWELLTVCAYFLIIYDDEKKSVCHAGYLYLVATHAGTFFLWAMFLILHQYTGSFNFDEMANGSLPLAMSGLIFVFAIIGFGVKAGFMPLHIWLPYAHPVAPSHISAILSGLLIKMGIYGLMRIIFIVKIFPAWCATALLCIGVISGIGGVLYALGQHEVKKLLAYHSIENIGIIALGMGMGLWGQIHQYQVVSVIGYTGALLHVFNHAIFKGLLFLSAGSVIRSTHTGEIDKLGGLLKLLPLTGHVFLIGSLSICGLPFFNGFISELLVYRSLFEGLFHGTMGGLILISVSIVSLALIGGLAAACFAKAFGVIFLGANRSIPQGEIKEQSLILGIPMVVLSCICIWIGLFPRTMVTFSLGAAASMYGTALSSVEESAVIAPFANVVTLLLIAFGLMCAVLALKRYATRTHCVTRAKTWGCGYEAPTPRMQYTASSFAQPLVCVFRNMLGYTTKGAKPEGYFAGTKGMMSTHVIESSETYIFKPLYRVMEFLALKMKRMQYGYTQLYLLYSLIFLLVLLIWKMN